MGRILIISDRIEEIERFTSYISSDVKYLITDFFDINIEKIKNQIDDTTISIGFVYHNDKLMRFPFGEMSEGGEYFNNMFRELIRGIRKEIIIDLLTCNLNEEFLKEEIRELGETIGVKIRYSLDETGGKSGNWILESDNVNVKDEYFNSGIDEWEYVLFYEHNYVNSNLFKPFFKYVNGQRIRTEYNHNYDANMRNIKSNNKGIQFWGNSSLFIPNNLYTVNNIVSAISNNSGSVIIRSDGTVNSWPTSPSTTVTNPLAIYSNGRAFAALTQSGGIVVWGNSSEGGSITTRFPTESDITSGVKEIYGNGSAFAALKEDGTVITWGRVGSGGSYSTRFPADSTLENVVTIYATNSAFAALKSDGTVITWGDIFRGGNYSTRFPTNRTLDNVVCIYSNWNSFAALKSDGSVVTWGLVGEGGSWNTRYPADKNLDSGVIEIFTTSTAFAALKSDGSVVTWGSTTLGGNYSTRFPSNGDLTKNVVKIFNTGTAFSALTSGGGVISWGSTSAGGNYSTRFPSGTNLTSGIINIYSTDSAFAALGSDGRVVTWGASTSGGSYSTKIPNNGDLSKNIKFIRSGFSMFAAITNSNQDIRWGSPNELVNAATLNGYVSSRGILGNNVISLTRVYDMYLTSNTVFALINMPPGIPTVNITPDITSLKFTISPATGDVLSLTQFRIASNLPNSSIIITGQLGQTEFTINNLLLTGYRFIVTAISENLEGTGVTTSTVTPIRMPSPTITNIMGREGIIEMFFNPPNNTGGTTITSYNVYRKSLATNQTESSNILVSNLLTSGSGYKLIQSNASFIGGTNWEYKVEAVGQTTSELSSGTIVSIPLKPEAPLLSVIAGNSENNIEITLGENYGFEITLIKLVENGNLTEINDFNFINNKYSFTRTQLVNGTSYTYKASVVNIIGESSFSSEVVSIPFMKPNKPIINLIEENSQITVVVTAPNNNGRRIDRYRINYRLKGGQFSSIINNLGGEFPYNDTVYKFIISGLVNGSEYEITVAAENEAGYSDDSDIASAIPKTVPDKPLNIEVINGENKLKIRFIEGVNNGGSIVLGYKVNLKKKIDNTNISNSIIRNEVSIINGKRELEIDNLENGIEYEVSVISSNIIGDSQSSDIIIGKPRTVPGIPIEIQTNEDIKSSSVLVSFKEPVSDGGANITSYRITSTTGETILQQEYLISELGISGGIYSKEIGGLINGSVYTFKVEAKNEAGYGLGVEKLGVIPYGVPNSPTLGTVTVDNRVFSIPFNVPNNNGKEITKYKVVAYIVFNVNNVDTYSKVREKEVGIGELVTNVITYSGLNPNVMYTFTLQAYNLRGYSVESSKSNKEEFLPTYPNLPTNPIQEIVIPDFNTLRYKVRFTAAVQTTPPIQKYRIYKTSTVDEVVDLNETEDKVILAGNELSFEVDLTSENNVDTYWQIFTENLDGISQNSEGEPISLLVIFNKISSIDSVLDIVNDSKYNTLFTTIHSKKNYMRSVIMPILIENYGLVKKSNISKLYSKSFYDTVGEPEGIEYYMYLVGSSGTEVNDISGFTTTNKITYFNLIPNDTIKFKTITNGEIYTISNTVHNSTSNNLESFTISSNKSGVNSEIFSVSGDMTEGFRYSGIRVVLVGGIGVTNDIETPGEFSVEAISGTLIKNEWEKVSSEITNYEIRIAEDESKIDSENIILNNGEIVNGLEFTISNFDSENSYKLRVNSSLSSINIGGFSRNKTIFFNIRAVNTNSKLISLPSTNINATTFTLPGKPTIVSITPLNSSARIAFSVPENTGGTPITGYKVVSNPGSKTGEGVSSPIVVSGLTNGLSYKFTVSAINMVGEGEGIESEVGVVPFGVPNKPVIQSVVSGEGKITLGILVGNNGREITSMEIIKNGVTNLPIVFEPTIENNIVTYEIGGLENGVSYNFKVRAFNEGGWSDYSEIVSGVPLTVPGAPVLNSVVSGNGKLTVNYSVPNSNGGSEIVGYRIYNGVDIIKNNIGANIVSVEIGELENGTIYEISVVAVNIIGESEKSNKISEKPKTVPGSPILVGLEEGNSQVKVFFREPTNNGGDSILRYKIKVIDSDNVETEVIGEVEDYDLDEGIYSKIVENLVNGEEYKFIVYGENSVIGYGSENINEEGISSFATPRTVPNSPENILIVGGNEELEVSFDRPNNNGDIITKYKIRGIYEGGVKEQEYELTEVQRGLTRLTLTFTGTNGLENGVNYTIKISGFNEAGYGSENSEEVIGRPRTVPGKPTEILVDVSVESNSGYVSFRGAVDNGGVEVTKYRIRAIEGENIIEKEFLLGDLELEEGIYRVKFGGLENGKSYVFRVEAFNVAGYGEESESSFGVIPYGVPSVPLIGVVSVNNRVFSIPYTNSSFNGGREIIGYNIEAYIVQEINGEKEYELLVGKDIELGENPVEYSGLSPNVEYVFRVRARNIRGYSGYSGYSNEVLFFPTYPSLPTNIKVDYVILQNSIKYKVSYEPGTNIEEYLVYKVGSLTEIVDTSVEPLIRTSETSFEVELNSEEDNRRTIYKIFTSNIDGISQDNGVEISVPVVYNPISRLDSVIERLGVVHNTRKLKKGYMRNVVRSIVNFSRDRVKYSNIKKFITRSIYNEENLNSGLEVYMSLVGSSNSVINDISTVWGRNKVVYFNVVGNDIVKFTDGNRNYEISGVVEKEGIEELERFSIVSSGLESREFIVDEMGVEGYRYGGIRVVMVGGVGITKDIDMPSNFEVVVESGSEVRLGWEYGGELTDFRIRVSSESGLLETEPIILNSGNIVSGDYEIVGYEEGKNYELRVDSGLRELVIGGFGEGSLVYFNIRANDTDTLLTSLPTETLSGRTFSRPGKPKNVVLEEGDSFIRVNFVEPDNNGGVEIEGYIVSIGGSNFVSGLGSPIDLLGLVNGEEYIISISAINVVGEGEYTESVVGVPYGVPIIGDIRVEEGDRMIGLYLNVDNNGREVSGVYVIINGGNEEEVSYEEVNGELYVEIGELENGLGYDIGVRVENIGGKSEIYEIIGVEPRLRTKPVISEIVGKDRRVELRVNLGELGGRLVERIIVSVGGREEEYSGLEVVNNEVMLEVGGLKNGEEVNFRVKIVDSSGDEGDYSEIVVGKAYVVPGKAGIGGVEVVGRELRVSWVGPEEDGGDMVIGYRLRVYLEGKLLGEVEGLENPLILGGLYEGLEYEVRVEARNRGGYGEESEGELVRVGWVGRVGYPRVESSGIRLGREEVRYRIRLIGGAIGYKVERSESPNGEYEEVLETGGLEIEDIIDINITRFYKIYTRVMDGSLLDEAIMVVYRPFSRLDEIIELMDSSVFRTRVEKKRFMREVIRPKVGYIRDEIMYKNLEKFVGGSIYTEVNRPNNLRVHMVIGEINGGEIIDISENWEENNISYFNLLEGDIVRFRKDNSGKIYRISGVKGGEEMESFRLRVEGIGEEVEYRVSEFDRENGFRFEDIMIPVVGGVGVKPYVEGNYDTPGGILPCFTSGTTVLTPNGYKRIEYLRDGDKVRTDDGRDVEIVKIYSFKVKGQNNTYPYVINPGFFGKIPGERTLISGGHKIKTKKGWILTKKLGLKQEILKWIKYYHIKLPNYKTDNLIINNGLIVESYNN